MEGVVEKVCQVVDVEAKTPAAAQKAVRAKALVRGEAKGQDEKGKAK